MSSSRLPGKVLRPLGDSTCLGQLVRRARAANGVHEVVVATSLQVEDDAVEVECRGLDVACVRGSLNDVLARFSSALRGAQADIGVRLTADCPLHDPAVISGAITQFHGGITDYLSNGETRTFPDGLDVEVFSSRVLYEAERLSESQYDREHVTPWLREHLQTADFTQAEDLSMLRWTLDTPADLAFIESAYRACGDGVFSAADVYRWLVREPESIWLGAPSDNVSRSDMVHRMKTIVARADACAESGV